MIDLSETLDIGTNFPETWKTLVREILLKFEDGVLIYHDGLIEIGGPRPSIWYFTNNPPRTEEATVFIDGFLSEYYELVIEVKKEYTYIAIILKED